MATATIPFETIRKKAPIELTDNQVRSISGSAKRLMSVHGKNVDEAIDLVIGKKFFDDNGNVKIRWGGKKNDPKTPGVRRDFDQKESKNLDLFLAVIFGLLSVGMTYLLIRAGMVVFGDHREGILKAALLEISIPVLHCIPYSHPVAKALQNILLAVCIGCSIFVIHSATDINKFRKIESTFQVSKIASSLNAANSMVLSEQRKQNSGKKSYISRSTSAAKAVKKNADAVQGLMASTGFNRSADATKWTDLALQGIMLILNVLFAGQAMTRLRRVL